MSNKAQLELSNPKAPDSAPRTVSLNCLVCTSSSIVRIRARMTNGYAVRCPVCTVASVWPFPGPDEVAKFYESYGVGPEEAESKESENLVRLHSPLVKYLSSVDEGSKGKPLSFFDYGCGPGFFLRQVVAEGHVATGAEFADRNCASLQKRSIETLNLREKKLGALKGRTFDRITLFQVVEHLLEPIVTLRELSSLLKADGYIYLECPNEDGWMYVGKSLTRRFFDRLNFFGTLNPPHHVHGFNRKSLTVLLEQAGLEVVEIGDYGMKDMLHQPETYYFYPSFTELFTGKNKLTPYYFAKWAIGVFDNFLSRIFKRGGGLYALAKKRKG